jgi:hypothetical protein
MRLLLDESVPKALGFLLEPHFVRSAQTAGFAGLLNGELLAAMKAAQYDLLVMFDQNLPYQQNVNLPVSVMVLKANDNRVATALKFAPLIIAALEAGLTQRLQILTLSE